MATKTNQELRNSHYPVLSAFSRALGREANVLAQHPDLLWQQMYNRIKREGSPLPEHLSIKQKLKNLPESHPFITRFV